MGIYLNPNNFTFKDAITREIYVDKSLLIEKTNYALNKGNKYICVSRPRRFGKSTDANMLVAYYSKGCQSDDLFKGLKISKCDGYKEHLNQYNVIHLNMQDFLSESNTVDEMIQMINDDIIDDLIVDYEQFSKDHKLYKMLNRIFAYTNEQFIFIIDEWDCVLRVYEDKEVQKKYLDFLRLLLKDKPYVSLAYMTGILPIKKNGTHSALNMFDEISMVNATPYEAFMGFTEEEVINLCEKYQIDVTEMKNWYDGYHLDNYSLYSPKSVVSAITKRKFDNYWSQTETYEALKVYIDLNFDGLKENIIALLAGSSVEISTLAFQNDMHTFASKDDILTLLVHLGYLGYNFDHKTVYIPNKEIVDTFTQAIKNSGWEEITKL